MWQRIIISDYSITTIPLISFWRRETNVINYILRETNIINYISRTIAILHCCCRK